MNFLRVMASSSIDVCLSYEAGGNCVYTQMVGVCCLVEFVVSLSVNARFEKWSA